MDIELLRFFEKKPEALPLYEALTARMEAELGDYTTKIQKTQISFSNRYGFAFVSFARMKGSPPLFITVTFGLGYRVESPRIAVSVEAHPNRWTHHVTVGREDEIDDELMGWIREAYDFSLFK